MENVAEIQSKKEYEIFEYFKCDPNWKKKMGKICGLFFGFILSYFSIALFLPLIAKYAPFLMFIFVLIFPLTFVLMFSLAGYFMINTNLRILKPQAGIYDFNFKKTFIVGLKLFGGTFCIAIATTIIGVALTLLVAIMKFNFLTNALLFLLQLACAIYTLAAIISFQIDLKFKSIIDVRRVILVAKKDLSSFVITILKLIVLQFVASIVGLISAITIIGPIIVGVYAGYIASEIQAQYVRGAFKIVQTEQ